MTDIEIRTGVPIPEVNTFRRRMLYPFDKMEIGDSIVVKGSVNKLTSAQQYAYRYGAEHNMKFACRKINDNEVGIWRTK